MTPELITATGTIIVALVGAIVAGRREARRATSDANEAAARATSALAEAMEATVTELRTEVQALRSELTEVRGEREAITEELGQLREAVAEALSILRRLPGAEPAIAVLEQQPTRRRRRAA